MSNYNENTPYEVTFHYDGENRWKSLSIQNLEISILFDRQGGLWHINAVVLKTGINWKFVFSGENHRKVLRSLFWRNELPRLLELSSSVNSTLYDVYKYINVRWQASDTPRFTNEPRIKQLNNNVDYKKPVLPIGKPKTKNKDTESAKRVFRNKSKPQSGPYEVKFLSVGEYKWVSNSIAGLRIGAEYNLGKGTWRISTKIARNNSGKSFVASVKNPNTAIARIFDQTELPMLLGLTSKSNTSLRKIYRNFAFRWQDKKTGQFETDPFYWNRLLQNLSRPKANLPKTSNKPIRFIFDQRTDGSWIWHNEVCFIEVVLIDSVWIATCNSKKIMDEAVNDKSLAVESSSKETALQDLLKQDAVFIALGLPPKTLPTNQYMFTVHWRQRVQRASLDIRASSDPLVFDREPCNMRTLTPHCDGTYDCSFCSSSGSAYFRRWDD